MFQIGGKLNRSGLLTMLVLYVLNLSSNIRANLIVNFLYSQIDLLLLEFMMKILGFHYRQLCHQACEDRHCRIVATIVVVCLNCQNVADFLLFLPSLHSHVEVTF